MKQRKMSRLIGGLFMATLTLFLSCDKHDDNLMNYGKTILVLTGDITDAEAVEIIASQLGTATQEVRIVGCTNLKTVDLSKLQSAVSIRLAGNDVLETLNFNGLKSLAGELVINLSPELKTLQFDGLESMALTEYSAIESTKLTALSFPSLVSITPNELIIRNNALLTSVAVPKLAKALLRIENNNSFSSLSAPELAQGSVYIPASSSLTTLSLPKFAMGDVTIYSSPSLTTLSLPKFVSGDVNITGSGLTSLSLPELTQGSVAFYFNSSIATASFPKWAEGSLVISSENSLASVSIPNLKSLSKLDIGSTPKLKSLALPTLTGFGDGSGPGYFSISTAGLSSADVNAILANLVQITPAIKNANIKLSMNPPAPPTGQGITDKATLRANGNTVNTD